MKIEELLTADTRKRASRISLPRKLPDSYVERIMGIFTLEGAKALFDLVLCNGKSDIL
jgi:hypothetical protein